MIPNYINDWLDVIENMNNDNTYKLAWGRAILECLYNKQCYLSEDGHNVFIKLDSIAECMLKYYWNQLFFFHLKQSPNKDRMPIICQVTNELIEEYKKLIGNSIPVWFDKAKTVFETKKEIYRQTIYKIVKILPNDVAWRFKIINKKEVPLYQYDAKRREEKIALDYLACEQLLDYGFILSKLLNYKWTQLLEKFNFAPKIASKVNGISQNKLRRNNLTKYKLELLKEFDGKPIDFYTGEILDPNDISVDHVIPWSYMYSDDLWNLVLTSKSNNSSKSNSIPSKEIIEKLKNRNLSLKKVVSDSFKKDLQEAISMNYVDKFYYECRS